MTTIHHRLHSSRRGFLKEGLLGAAAVAACISPAPLRGDLTKPQRVPDAGLKLGLTSYTLRKFTLDQAIALTRQAGLKYISLKDMHLPLKSSSADRQAAKEKVAAAGLVLMGGGVIYMKNSEPEIRSYFDYAKDAGMPTIICSPEVDALDTVERLAKEYQIRIAIHNHGPGDKNYPSPLDVLMLVKDRDSLMGICMDVGHTVRVGQDPVEAIQKCADRLHDFHMKDVTQAVPQGRGTEVGRGVIDIVGVLRALVQIKYVYQLAFEYEENETAPMPGLSESVGYVHGALATF